MTGDNVAVVRSLYDGFSRGDLAAVLALVTEDFELVDMAMGQTFNGPAGFQQWLGTFLTAAPDTGIELTNVVASGEWVVTEHTGRGTHTGPLQTPGGALAPTGRSFALPFAEFFRLRDGKIALIRAYYDVTSLLRQLGVVA